MAYFKVFGILVFVFLMLLIPAWLSESHYDWYYSGLEIFTIVGIGLLLMVAFGLWIVSKQSKDE